MIQLLIFSRQSILPTPIEYTEQNDSIFVTDLAMECKYLDNNKTCNQHVFDNLAFYKKAFYPRDAPYTKKEYEQLNIKNVAEKISVTIKFSSEQFEADFLDEFYEIKVNEKIEIKANTHFGVARAFSTLSQLIEINPEDPIDKKQYQIKFLAVKDAPFFKWREVAIDAARHFLSIKQIKHQIDAAAIAKFNVLRIRFSDTQSFALKFQNSPQNNLQKGAYHTKFSYSIEDLKELQKYAFQRGLIVAPEINIPGHAHSWGKADPSLIASCTKSIQKNLDKAALNPINPDVFKYIKGVLEELFSIEQSFNMTPVIGFGGGVDFDYECWKEDSSIKAFLENNTLNITSYELLYQYFYDQLNLVLNELNPAENVHFVVKYLFDEAPALHKGVHLRANSLILFQSASKQETAIEKGYKVISTHNWQIDNMKFGKGYYFYQDTWQDFYVTNILHNVHEKYYDRIWGGAAQVQGFTTWGFNLDGMLYPRSLAVAEVLWANPMSSTVPNDMGDKIDALACKLYQTGINTGPIKISAPCIGYPQ